MLMQEEEVLKGQELENAVSDANYTQAIQLAFKLRRPHRLYELFAGLCRLAFFYFCCLNLVGIPLTDFSAGREGLKIKLTKHSRHWTVKSSGPYLAMFESGIQNQSFVMLHSLCFSEFSISSLQQILFRSHFFNTSLSFVKLIMHFLHIGMNNDCNTWADY